METDAKDFAQDLIDNFSRVIGKDDVTLAEIKALFTQDAQFINNGAAAWIGRDCTCTFTS